MECLIRINKLLENIGPVILMSLKVSMSSALIASAAGISLGVPVALKNFTLKRHIIRVSDTLMSMPPVLMGLLVYLLLSRSGPLGELRLLFTPTAMIIAQSLLIFPIVFGLTVSYFSKSAAEIRKICLALGAENKDIYITIIKEGKGYILSLIALAFGRAISEVGAVMMVGGNIKGYTRVMTTYIALETGKGKFGDAIIIGIVLLSISFLINYLLNKIKEDNEL
ncbi:ABC transporter permease [Clostridium polynesiense]|uniref:ABC transporter permease n=1 Tax=Clostridium polynesiense TaxID=1325933 RepID=UPI00058D5EB2|nr:ABC transporter permease [Clostridium polynesiense]